MMITTALMFVSFYLGVGVGFVSVMRSQNAPKHWTNYPMLILGWPIVLLSISKSINKIKGM